MAKACKKKDRNRSRLSSKVYLAERRAQRNKELRMFRTLCRQPSNVPLRAILNDVRPDLVDKADRIVAARELRQEQKNV